MGLFATASIEWLWDKLRKRRWIPDVAAEARIVLAMVAAQVRGLRDIERTATQEKSKSSSPDIQVA